MRGKITGFITMLKIIPAVLVVSFECKNKDSINKTIRYIVETTGKPANNIHHFILGLILFLKTKAATKNHRKLAPIANPNKPAIYCPFTILPLRPFPNPAHALVPFHPATTMQYDHTFAYPVTLCGANSQDWQFPATD